MNEQNLTADMYIDTLSTTAFIKPLKDIIKDAYNEGYSNGKACKSENDTSNTENVTIINYQSDTDNYTKIIDILNHLRTSNEYLYIYSSGEDEDNIIDRTTHIAIGLKEDAIKFEVFGKVRYTTISNITRLECNPNKYHKLKFATVQV